MDTRRFLGPSFLAAGTALLGAGLLRGEARLALVLIFPVIEATGPWSALGVLFLVAGFFTTFLFWPFRTAGVLPPALEPISPDVPPPAGAPRVGHRWGGVVFLGPFPIVFGSDQRVTSIMLVLGIVLFLALVTLTLLAWRP